MLYLNLVKKTYQEAIALNPTINSDLRAALKSHERMPLLFKNLAIELEKVQADRVNKWKKPFPEKTLKALIYDMVDVFIMGVEMEVKKRYQSDMERIEEEAKIKAQKDLEATASGVISGDFEEIFKDGEITTTDERSIV